MKSGGSGIFCRKAKMPTAFFILNFPGD